MVGVEREGWKLRKWLVSGVFSFHVYADTQEEADSFADNMMDRTLECSALDYMSVDFVELVEEEG